MPPPRATRTWRREKEERNIKKPKEHRRKNSPDRAEGVGGEEALASPSYQRKIRESQKDPQKEKKRGRKEEKMRRKGGGVGQGER